MKNWSPITKGIVVVGMVIIIGIESYEAIKYEESHFSPFVVATSANKDTESVQQLESDRHYPSRGEFVEMVRRPLFSSGRRFLQETETENAIAEPEEREMNIRYIGSMSDGENTVAFVDEGHGIRSISVGEEVAGWEVVRIEFRRMIIMRWNESRELLIFNWE